MSGYIKVGTVTAHQPSDGAGNFKPGWQVHLARSGKFIGSFLRTAQGEYVFFSDGYMGQGSAVLKDIASALEQVNAEGMLIGN
jgi:hypothetical protein